MLYSCTHMVTVGDKGLTTAWHVSEALFRGLIGVDSPKISCARNEASLDDLNAFIQCDVRAKPKATSIFWIVSANGTTVSGDEVIDDCWTVIRVRATRDARGL